MVAPYLKVAVHIYSLLIGRVKPISDRVTDTLTLKGLIAYIQLFNFSEFQIKHPQENSPGNLTSSDSTECGYYIN